MSTQAAMFLCPSKFSIGELHNALVAIFWLADGSSSAW